MSDEIKFRWGDLQSRMLKLTEPTDWAILPNNKEKRIFELLTTVLRRFPMQKEWPPEHHDLKPHDWHERRRGITQLLMTDAEFGKLVREFKLQDNMLARALARYLGLKHDEEHAAMLQWALNEEAFRRILLKNKNRLLRQQILERLNAQDEQNRMVNRYAAEQENQRKIMEQRVDDYQDSQNLKKQRQIWINRQMQEASEQFKERALEMIKHDMEFRAETRNNRFDEQQKIHDKYWQDRHKEQKRNEWLLKTLPDRENLDAVRLANIEWRAETHAKVTQAQRDWIFNDRLQTHEDQQRIQSQLADEASAKQDERQILANRSQARLTGALDALDENTRFEAASQSNMLSQSTGRASYKRSSGG